ncbi:Uncharacterised protein [Halioglobus japonicus]|nr:Uncharacterised protein [Halioglobus japonicus]
MKSVQYLGGDVVVLRTADVLNGVFGPTSER